MTIEETLYTKLIYQCVKIIIIFKFMVSRAK